MKYPSKSKIHIYLCDDGRRKEMEQLCKRMRINYIKRSNNKDAKAGNYNNALKNTKSPYIATFDADMQPSPDFLMKTVPFLIEDKKVGFVQVPQSFRNPDIYQIRYKLIGKVPHEQDYFFDKIQAAKNKTNAVIYCGTNAVFLRKALKDAGGFATQSVTEDIATGIQIQSKGYKGISLSDKMAYGIAVNNLDSYIKQKSRWCRGCLQTFKNYSVINNKGLTIRQKLDYLSTLFYWSFGFRQIFSMIIPLLFPLFGIKMIKSNVYVFVILFFIQFFFKRFAVDFAEKNAVSSTWNRIYETILFPTIAIDLFKEIYNIGKSKFEVSPKFKEKTHMSFRNLYLIIVHGICFLVTLFALIVSIIQVLNSRFDYYIIPIFWLTSNLMYLTFALIFDLSLKEMEDIGVTDKQVNKYSIKNPIDIVVNFIKEGKNLYLHSAIPGNGKSSWSLRLAEAYFNKIWARTSGKCRVLFISVPRFLLAIKDNISAKSSYVEYIKDNVLEADLVIWDDLASKVGSEFELSHLLSLIDNRLVLGKSNIYTSNLNKQQLYTAIGERLASRVANMSIDIELFGSDKRILKVGG